MTAYYNEFDPAAAHILRYMIAEGVIAPGVVDERSIKDVTPDDLRDFTQVHLFAGGGFWSVAARLAGWPDDEPLWTASCPCQPFSAAGQGGGIDDPRHLWPDVYRLARAIRPALIVGEQVAAKAGYGWFDGVRADLAREDYASRSVDFPACSVNAPHQRNRQYWIALADADCEQQRRRGHPHGQADRDDAGAWAIDQTTGPDGAGSGERGPLGHTVEPGLEGQYGYGDTGGRPDPDRPVTAADGGERLSPDADVAIVQGQSPAGQQPLDQHDAGLYARIGTYWSDAEWIVCHDDKARRAKPGVCNVAHGVSGGMDRCSGGGDENIQEADYSFLVKDMIGRVNLWRVSGNAIVPEAAKEVIAAFIDVYGLPSTWSRS